MKRITAISILFILSIFALKYQDNQHPLPKDAQTLEDLKKTAEKKEAQKKLDQLKRPLTVAEKKQVFRDKLVPAVESAYKKLDKQYNDIKQLLKKNPNHPKVVKLKVEYDAKTNHELLLKLKPHPKSVTLAQAAIESAWGTSRFFLEANNVFGVWSFDKNEPRIPASGTRGAKVIYLKKYATIEDSVLDYYKILSKAGAYHKFRVQNYSEPNPYQLVKHLDKYSEKRAEYGRMLSSLIGYNQFTSFDEKFYPKPKKKKKEEINKEKTTETKQNNESVVSDANITKDNTTNIDSNKTSE